MATPQLIASVSAQIVEAFHPEQIILFGSHAYGTSHTDSDVDLLVIMAHSGDDVYQAIAILDRVPPPFPIDLLVRTPDAVQQRLAQGDSFLHTILTRGQVLYAAAHR
jgi:predicted nucleotidyltransferase